MIGVGVYRRLVGSASVPTPRRDRILKYVTKAMRGVEIGPYHSPLAPRREGYQCLSLDIFPAGELRRWAEDDPNISADTAARIEDVDLIGTAADIDRLVGQGTLEYVISSHNLEHLPDPIRFLDLTCFECIVVATPGTNVFDVLLRKMEPRPLTEEEFYPRRVALMRRVAREVAQKV